MPLNLLRQYNALLDFGGMNPYNRRNSLMGIFNRDIQNNPKFNFRGKAINPTPKDGEIPMETLFTHLTTEIIDLKTRAREFDHHRSVRLHWIKYHINERKTDDMLIFSCRDKDGNRTYIYDKIEFYVIVLEPKTKTNDYFLLTAYYLRGKDKFKIENKYKRRLDELL